MINTEKTERRLITGMQILAAGLLVFKFLLVPVTDMNHYPFIVSIDTWEWLAQARHYLGDLTTNYYRPPLFSLIFAVLYKAGLENYTGFVPQLSFALLLIAAYLMVRKLYGDMQATCLALILLCNATVFIHSYYLNPDFLCISLVTLAVAVVVSGGKGSVFWAWVIMAVSFLAQFLAPALAVFAAALLLRHGWSIFRKKEAYTGFAVCLLIVAVYISVLIFVLKGYLFGYWVLRFTGFAQFRDYLLMIMRILGIPGMLLVAVYLVRCALHWREERGRFLFLAVWFTAIFIFFSFFMDSGGYVWRYNLYFSIPLFIMASAGLCVVLSKVRPVPVKMLIVLAVLFCQHMAVRTDALWPGTAFELVIAPGKVYRTASGIGSEQTVLTGYYMASMTGEALQLRADKNKLPEDSADISDFLSKTLEKDEYFFVLPMNFLTERLAPKWEFMSGRRKVDFKNKSAMDMKGRALVLYGKTTFSEKELSTFEEYLARLRFVEHTIDLDYSIFVRDVKPE